MLPHTHFRYTKDMIQFLTNDQRMFYEKNGYLMFPRLIEQDVLDKCNERFNDIVEGRIPQEEIIVMYDVKDRKSVNKIQDIHRDPVFNLYIKHKKILDIVECFTGPNILAIHSMLISKPPDIGFGTSRHPPHQDLHYFPLRPVDLIVASWTAIERCDEQNGCLYVAPGSHQIGRLLHHDYPPAQAMNKFYHGIQDIPTSIKWVNLEMEPGDTVFFHPLLIHGSGINKSNRKRPAISCHYAAAECNAMEELVPDNIKNEILTYLKKKNPEMNVTYTDIWRYKTTLARGIRSSF